MLPLIAEFCVRTGHLNELLEATKKPKFPTASLAMMVMELEEMVALNFNLFSDSQLEAMPNELVTLRENSELTNVFVQGRKRQAAGKEPALQARVRGHGPGGRFRFALLRQHLASRKNVCKRNLVVRLHISPLIQGTQQKHAEHERRILSHDEILRRRPDLSFR